MTDAEALVRYADNREIWINLRDQFPHPYRTADAHDWLSWVTRALPETNFAIEVTGEAAGGIGYRLGEDVERYSAEIGYWLGEPFWGRDITTEALRAVTEYAINTHGLTRVFAVPFDGNTASCRVLEKVGFELEGRMRQCAVKDGKVVDQLLYAFVPVI